MGGRGCDFDDLFQSTPTPTSLTYQVGNCPSLRIFIDIFIENALIKERMIV
jgi:hypothetical protein